MKKSILILTALSALILFSCTDDDVLMDGESDGRTTHAEDGSSKVETGASEGAGSGSQGQAGDSTSQIQPGQITAGEWNDLDNWSFWQDLTGQNQEIATGMNIWKMNSFNRYKIWVTNQSLFPIVDARVELRNSENKIIWTAHTDNKGYCNVWNLSENTSGLLLKLYVRQEEYTLQEILPYGTTEQLNHYKVEGNAPSVTSADIMFTVDATGSMGDELEYLKTELMSIVERVSSAHPNADLSYGSVFYRDKGDDYITRISRFDRNAYTTNDFINNQSASGGGDYPEAVDAALEASINQMNWSESARTRLLFLVLDAPPHQNETVIAKISELIENAASKGIKIIPVTASGIDKTTEFLMRSFAIFTNGTYVFITDHSGIGGDHIEPTIGDYEVEKLNDLIVRLVSENIE
jgi:hypothetical protein